MSSKIDQSKVAVLMATFNGIKWLPEQLQSILSQQEVDLSIFISDDISTDDTYDWINRLAEVDTRINILPRNQSFGSAAKNFYRLISDVDISGFDYIAFADQDDIWNLDKLSKHINLLVTNSAEAVSSNVIAFWPNEKHKFIDKAQTQRTYDYLFESAGPGCTFLMTPWLINQIRYQLQHSEIARQVSMHDWLAYAICRAHGRRWVIDSSPSIMYRQHDFNVIGANSGFKAIFTRVGKIKNGWYRNEVIKICRVVMGINKDLQLAKLIGLLQRKSFLSRLRLLPFILHARRKWSDRIVLLFSVACCLF